MDTPDKARDVTADYTIPKSIRVFRLKNAWAEDRYLSVNGRNMRIQGVASILRSLVQGKSTSVQAERAGAPVADQEPSNGSSVEKLTSVNYKKTLPDLLQDMEKRLAPKSPPQPERHEDSDVVVQAAERLNAVVIRDSYLNMPYYQMVIDQLDVPLHLVEIKATIVDISSDAIKSLGVDWHGGVRDGDLQVFASSQNSTRGTEWGFNAMGEAVSGLSLGTILGQFADDFFLARINAMESKGKAKIVSRPSVITFDNIEAQFKHTDSFFVRVAGERDVGLYEISTGIVLKVTPHVIDAKGHTKIQLIVNVEDGMVTGNYVDNIPVLKNSNINTQAIVDENNSLLIGGLIHDQDKTEKNKVPVLGDIPLLGAMFQYKTKTKSKMERLFLISPRIIESKSAELEKGLKEITKDKRSPRRDLSDILVNKGRSGRKPRRPDVAGSQVVIFTLKI
jgi:type III secretion protein C